MIVPSEHDISPQDTIQIATLYKKPYIPLGVGSSKSFSWSARLLPSDDRGFSSGAMTATLRCCVGCLTAAFLFLVLRRNQAKAISVVLFFFFFLVQKFRREKFPPSGTDES